jgi:hypothetical protein
MRIFIAVLMSHCLLATPLVSSFNGTWRQQMAANLAKARTPKELFIKMNAVTLAVKMTGSGKVATVDVSFQIGGPTVTYTGLDGDQFTLKATRNGADLVFDGDELEHGQVLTIHEVWTTKTEGNLQTLVDSRTTTTSRGRVSKTTIYERVQS